MEAENSEEKIVDNKFLTFKIGNEQYGVGIAHVMEIIEMIKITPMPEGSNCIRGVINLRGKVIPVMDVRLRFSMEERPFDARTCIVVVKIIEKEIGLIVDTVSEVMEIPLDQIGPPPDLDKNQGEHFVMGMGKLGEEVIILLDLNHLVHQDEILTSTEEGISK